MAQFTLYIDCVGNEIVRGVSAPTPADMPRFVQGDTISFRIYLLDRTDTYPISSPFSIVNIAALSLKVALGPKNGSAGSTLYTQQFTWEKDGTNSYFYADLPLNTSAINTLIGAAESALAWFEVEYSQAGYPTTVLQKQVTIHANVIEEASVVTPAGATAMTAEEANNTFVKNENTGFILVCPDDDTKRAYVYLGSDGALHVDPLT